MHVSSLNHGTSRRRSTVRTVAMLVCLAASPALARADELPNHRWSSGCPIAVRGGTQPSGRPGIYLCWLDADRHLFGVGNLFVWCVRAR